MSILAERGLSPSTYQSGQLDGAYVLGITERTYEESADHASELIKRTCLKQKRLTTPQVKENGVLALKMMTMIEKWVRPL